MEVVAFFLIVCSVLYKDSYRRQCGSRRIHYWTTTTFQLLQQSLQLDRAGPFARARHPARNALARHRVYQNVAHVALEIRAQAPNAGRTVAQAKLGFDRPPPSVLLVVVMLQESVHRVGCFCCQFTLTNSQWLVLLLLLLLQYNLTHAGRGGRPGPNGRGG